MDIFRGFLVLGYLPKGIRSLLSICMAGMCYELALQPKTSTFSGIPHCMNFTEPENNRTKMEKHVATILQICQEKEWTAYGWNDFKRQSQTNSPSIFLLLPSSSMRLSMDGHKMGLARPATCKSASECLHSRIPVITDTQNTALCIT